jgi:beta-N-acetylhexosaminidase
MKLLLKHKFSLLAVAVILFGLWWWAGAFLLARSLPELAELNTLRQELELEPIKVTETTTFPWEAWAQYNKVSSALSARSELERQKQDIIQVFEAGVESYFTRVKAHTSSAQIFSTADYKSVSFNEKKDLTGFLNLRKDELLTYLLKQNSNGQIAKRWQTDAAGFAAKASLRHKVSQLFSVTVDGTSVDSAEAALLAKYRPGGVVLLGTNVQSEAQVRALTKQLQATSPELPLFIMIDQEGGVVKRIWWDNAPSARGMSLLGATAQCDQLSARAELLRKLGINFNLGTIADATGDASSFIYSRVFGGNYSAVASFVERSQQCGGKIVNTLKHYPGHGATTLDTHQQLAYVNLGLKEWQQTHFLPFAKASNTSAIMMAHIVLPAVDSKEPASLSAKHVRFLREKGFEGILITDDMLMLDAAGQDRLTSVIKAIKAGQTIALYAADINTIRPLIDAVITKVKAGELSEALIDQANKYIIARKNILLAENGLPIPAELVY